MTELTSKAARVLSTWHIVGRIVDTATQCRAAYQWSHSFKSKCASEFDFTARRSFEHKLLALTSAVASMYVGYFSDELVNKDYISKQCARSAMSANLERIF
eukprot:5593-Heterococcus_DN1.PRE.11